jgi:Ca-activated chloride channel family protein
MRSPRRQLATVLVIAVGLHAPANVDGQFSAEANLVVLNVRVTDRDGRHVPNLPREAFTVFEDGRPQPVAVFAREDAPVTVGLVIDSSISMWAIRDRLVAGATAFAAAGHADNELFAVAFNDRRWPALAPSAPFTGDPAVLNAGLTRVVQPRGRTALFDAIQAGLDYAARGTHTRRALVLLSDGGDNASATTFDEVIEKTLASNTVIYGVALVDPVDRSARPEILRRLARATGGEAFTPTGADDVRSALHQVAEDIRRSYTLGYVPAASAAGTYHSLDVAVSREGGRGDRVRTREGYRAGPRGEEEEVVHVGP